MNKSPETGLWCRKRQTWFKNMQYNWRKKLIEYLDGERLARLEMSLDRDPRNYVLDPRNAAKIPESDIELFFRAVDSGILEELPNGDLLAPRSGAKERLYWHGSKTTTPVRVGISVEPVITIGAVSRLARDYGWPIHCIGMQTGKWGFDLTCFSPASKVVLVQCEVKTSERDVERMCKYFEHYSGGNRSEKIGALKPNLNFDRKISELISTRPKILWALGPGRYERVYNLNWRGADDELHLEEASASILAFNKI